MKLYKYKNNKCNLSGAKIKRFSKQAGMSQEKLAAVLQLIGLDLNQKAVSRIETGDRVVPDFELLYFARALQVSVMDLLTES